MGKVLADGSNPSPRLHLGSRRMRHQPLVVPDAVEVKRLSTPQCDSPDYTVEEQTRDQRRDVPEGSAAAQPEDRMNADYSNEIRTAR